MLRTRDRHRTAAGRELLRPGPLSPGHQRDDDGDQFGLMQAALATLASSGACGFTAIGKAADLGDYALASISTPQMPCDGAPRHSTRPRSPTRSTA